MTTLRELIEKGICSLDEPVTFWSWDMENPERPTDADEFADEYELEVGAEFELQAGLGFRHHRKYRVTGVDDGSRVAEQVRCCVCNSKPGINPITFESGKGGLTCVGCSRVTA